MLPAAFGVDHVTGWSAWDGLDANVPGPPRPPPSCPTIMIDVGTPEVAPGGTGKLFVKLIASEFPVGTVMTTGDHVPAEADLLSAAQGALGAGMAVALTQV